MERKATSDTEKARYIDGVLDLMDSKRTEGLERAKGLQQMKQAHLEFELQRLTKKYGPNHARVQKIQARLSLNTKMFEALDAQIALSKIKTEEFSPDTWRMQGFVVNKNSDPLAELVVSVNEQEQTHKGHWAAQTDSQGFYSITIDKDALQRLKESKVLLQVSDGKKRILYSGNSDFTLAAGIIQPKNFVIA